MKNKNNDLLVNERKRFQTVDYFHRAPTVYNRNQINVLAKKTTNFTNIKKKSLSFDGFNENTINLLINNEIFKKPRNLLIRRKSCYCSECGNLTSYEKKTKVLLSKIRMNTDKFNNNPPNSEKISRTQTNESRASLYFHKKKI